ncbi:MAG: bifunctional 3-deoxy-7-phosphoheptulonate synthase/chorismate mutase type II [Bacteroidales bacterium]|nr:bifunctional 3-deoxy-7-phosphoheptulonate synthase/chorismate mutase type II [Bacteroidales bacterium]
MTSTLKINSINAWLKPSDLPLIISGPCSAESEEQVLETAKELAKIDAVKLFRAGVWKPRTRPNMFEGHGEKALKWMQRAKKETGLKTTIEVANPKHVELALKYDIDVLWIGARSVVNPFSVQEIADVLKGVDIPVMVKNPLNPDLALWIGALERLNEAGITKLAAIHRGFDFFKKSAFRNAPMWEIPIELKRLFPTLPIITDPSHISGKRSLLAEIAQKAFDLEMDGLMIETHCNPDKALTDAKQQIKPQALQELLNHIIIRERKGDVAFESKLEEYRSEIDRLDAEMINILARRLDIIDLIGQYKKENNITILQLKRWSNIIQERLENGKNLGVDTEFLTKVLELVHKESIARQTRIYNKK